MRPIDFVDHHETSLPGEREEVDFFEAKYEQAGEMVQASLTELQTLINELAVGRFAPSVVGQRIIHTLARERISIAGDIPLREEQLDSKTGYALNQLIIFEKAAIELLRNNQERILRNNIEGSVENLMQGATAEECAMRLVTIAFPDARLYYPSEEDEHNGVDFIVVTESGSLAVQVKIIRYKYDREHEMPLIYIASEAEDIDKICRAAIQTDALDYRDTETTANQLYVRAHHSMSKNFEYTQQLASDGTIRSALMPISTSQINPRLATSDVERLENFEL